MFCQAEPHTEGRACENLVNRVVSVRKTAACSRYYPAVEGEPERSEHGVGASGFLSSRLSTDAARDFADIGAAGIPIANLPSCKYGVLPATHAVLGIWYLVTFCTTTHLTGITASLHRVHAKI